METSKIVLDPWQKEILNYRGNVILCTGRQVGKTTIFAIKAAEYLIRNPGHKIIIVSLTEDQAKLIIVMILDYIEKHYKNMIAKGAKKPTQNRIILKNNASALARPVGNTGDAVRGFTGNVLIIDEASRMPELVWSASKPTLLTTAGEIWMCSTPFGKQGYFWEAFQNKNERFKVFHISSEDVVTNRELSDVWTERKRKEAIKFLEEEKRDMSDLQYGQEYLGLFLDDLRRFFSDELIEKVCTLKRPQSISHAIGKTYLGCDIARMGNDEGTLEIISEINNYYIHQESIITKKQLTTETEQRIISTAILWNCKKVGIDAGAGTLGVSILDHLLKSTIKHKVIALNNRAIALDSDGKKKQRLLKEDMYSNLLNMMELGEIKLLDDDEVISSLRSVQFEFIKSDNNLAKMKIFGNYTHVVEGIIRAAWIAKKEKSLNLWAR